MSDRPPLRMGFEAMASRCEVQIDGAHDLQQSAAAAVAEVRRIEHKYSRYRADSIVSRLNAAAGGGESVEVDDETWQLLDFADQIHAQSGGLFDITSGVLRRAWDFRAARLPDPAQIDALLPLIGWSAVQRRDRQVLLPRAGMEIDFGGFGKEYAADRAALVLMQLGLRHGYVNLGGDIRVLGPRRDGTPWRFGIQHPRRSQELVATLELDSGALATSGDYERFFERDGRRYCHILDPRTGWPVSHWQSVSVVAPLCVAAGALCTIAMLLGPAATAFLDSQQALWLGIDASGQMQPSAAAAAAG